MKWWGQILTLTKNACIHANENIYTYTSWVIYTHRGVQSNMKTLWLQWIPWDRGILCKWAMVAAYRWCFSSGRRALVIATACFSSGILCKRALTPSDSAYRCCFSSGMRTSGNAVYSYIQIHVHALISGESIHSRIRINITLIHAYQLQCTRASFPWLGLVRCVCVTVCVCVCACVRACVLNISECESSCYTGRDWASFVNSGPQSARRLPIRCYFCCWCPKGKIRKPK
jgi:hypothetical protein